MKFNSLRFAALAGAAGGMLFAQSNAPSGMASRADQTQPQATLQQKRENMRQRFFQELNLSAAQQQQVTSIFQQSRQSSAPLRQQLRQNQQALEAAIRANDTNQIHSLSQQQATLRSQLTESRADAMAKFYSTLSPDQKAKADQIHQQMRQRWQQRMNQHSPAGG